MVYSVESRGSEVIDGTHLFRVLIAVLHYQKVNCLKHFRVDIIKEGILHITPIHISNKSQRNIKREKDICTKKKDKMYSQKDFPLLFTNAE